MKPSIAGVTTVDEYIQGFPASVRARLKKLRATIRRVAPQATEKISYRMPTFYLNGNLVHFAAYEHHIGLYPTPSGIAEFQEAMKPYKRGKGSIQFPHDEPLPLELIADIVRFRVRANSRKAVKR